MKIATAAEMKELDRRAIEDSGIPGVCLMQSAGEALARACVEELGGFVHGKRVAILCGKGNNGGDGFVAARFLKNAGARVSVYAQDGTQGFAAIHRGSIAAFGLRVDRLGDVALEGCALVVDCLLGSGAVGAPRGEIAAAIARVNASGVRVVACDLPSGVDADTGKVPGDAVRAARTVTFALPKPGLLLFPGAEHVGRVMVADIGIPTEFSTGLKREITTARWVRRELPERTQDRDANKGSHGKLLVVAGSRGMAGAAVLTATAALRAGAGLVYLAVPESLVPIVQTLAPEVVLRPLPDSGKGALEILREAAAGVGAVAIGPGLGQAGETRALVESFLNNLKIPVVVDADGFLDGERPAMGRSAVGFAEVCRAAGDRTAMWVLTPHPGEAARLLGISTAAVQDDREGAASALATKYGATVLLKGARTLVATPVVVGQGGNLFYNRLGSVALGTAGSGDVLTGVIGALLAAKDSAITGGEGAGYGQGVTAARAGAWLHARAGELCEAEIGAVGVVAREIAERLPEARRRLYMDIETENEL